MPLVVAKHPELARLVDDRGIAAISSAGARR
jgi:hypothetical protein